MKRTKGFRLATVGGVPVTLTAGWLIIVVVMAYVFTPLVQARMNLAFGPAIVVALFFPLMLAFSVLAHELAHGLSAQSFGVEVKEYVITLWGGHTTFRGEIDRPGVSAAVAFAGPAANIVLAGVGWIGSSQLHGSMAFFSVTFALTNVLLATFNLLPAAPLDGGKVTEALIWKITGNKLTGMRATGRLGQVVAVVTALGFVAWPYYWGRTDPMTVMVGVIVAMVIWRGASQTLAVAKMRAGTQDFHLGPYLVPATLVSALTPVAQINRMPVIVSGLGSDGQGYGLIDPHALDSVPVAARESTPASALARVTVIHTVTQVAGSESVSQIAHGLNAGVQVFLYAEPSEGANSVGSVWLIDIDQVLAELKRREA